MTWFGTVRPTPQCLLLWRRFTESTPPFLCLRSCRSDWLVACAHCLTTCTLRLQNDPMLYARAVTERVRRFRVELAVGGSSHDAGLPLVVNTHGWVRGIGLDLLHSTLQAVAPHHIVKVCEWAMDVHRWGARASRTYALPPPPRFSNPYMTDSRALPITRV